MDNSYSRAQIRLASAKAWELTDQLRMNLTEINVAIRHGKYATAYTLLRQLADRTQVRLNNVDRELDAADAARRD